MITSPLVAVALSFALEPTSRFRTLVFWVETLAVWTFAASRVGGVPPAIPGGLWRKSAEVELVVPADSAGTQ
jgi:hypothetical protein